MVLSGTDVGPDQGDERSAQPKDEGHQEVFEARAGAVASNRRRPEPSDETRGDDDGEIGLHGDQGCDRAYPQDVAEERPAKVHIMEGKSDEASPRPEIASEDGTAKGIVRHHRHRATGDAEPWEGPPTKDETGRQGDQCRGTDTGDDGRYHHGTGTTDHIGSELKIHSRITPEKMTLE